MERSFANEIAHRSEPSYKALQQRNCRDSALLAKRQLLAEDRPTGWSNKSRQVSCTVRIFPPPARLRFFAQLFPCTTLSIVSERFKCGSGHNNDLPQFSVLQPNWLTATNCAALVVA